MRDVQTETGGKIAGLQLEGDAHSKIGKGLAEVNGVQQTTLALVLPQLERPITYITGLENLDFQVAHFPLGLPEEHIEVLIQAGILRPENVFTVLDSDPEFYGQKRLEKFHLNEHVPQIVGYRISGDNELRSIIRNPVILETIRQQVVNNGEYPIIHMMNHVANLAYANYIGGRLPTQEENLEMMDALPGVTMQEKIENAGFPLAGCFYAPSDTRFIPPNTYLEPKSNCFASVGCQTMSSSITLGKFDAFIGIQLSMDGVSGIRCFPENAYVPVVVFDKTSTHNKSLMNEENELIEA